MPSERTRVYLDELDDRFENRAKFYEELNIKKTKYLTDKEPEEFEHLMKPLAEERINAMNILKQKLVNATTSKDYGTIRYKQIQKRYEAVVKAIYFWEKLLREE